MGREGELEVLEEDSGAVVIAGDAGVGKSRLVAELERRALADDKVLEAGGFTRVRRATETPFNIVLEARP